MQTNENHKLEKIRDRFKIEFRLSKFIKISLKILMLIFKNKFKHMIRIRKCNFLIKNVQIQFNRNKIRFSNVREKKDKS